MSWLRFPRNLGIVCCLYFLTMTVLFGSMSLQNSAFSASAREVQGTVVEMVAKPLPGGTRTGTRHMEAVAPKVQYVVDGRTYDYTPARGRRHPTVKVGDPVTVLYDAADPAGSARLRGEGSVALPLVTVGFLLSALGLVVLLVLTRRRRRSPGAPPRGRRPQPDQADAVPAVAD